MEGDTSMYDIALAALEMEQPQLSASQPNLFSSFDWGEKIETVAVLNNNGNNNNFTTATNVPIAIAAPTNITNSMINTHEVPGTHRSSTTITPPSASITSPDLNIEPLKDIFNNSVISKNNNRQYQYNEGQIQMQRAAMMKQQQQQQQQQAFVQPITTIPRMITARTNTNIPVRPKNYERVIAKGIKRNELFASKELLCFVLAFNYLDCRDLVIVSTVCKLWRNTVSSSDRWKSLVMKYETTLQGHVGKINAIARIGKYIFTGSADGKVKAWLTTDWTCAKTLNKNKYPSPEELQLNQLSQKTDQIHSSSSNSGVYTASSSTTATTTTTTTAVASSTPLQPLSPTNSLSHSSYSNQAPSVKYKPVSITALAASNYTLFIGLDTGQILCQDVVNTNQGKKAQEILDGHKGAINSIVVDQKRQLIISASSDHTIGIWDINNRVLKHSLSKHSAPVSCLAISNDYLFSGSWDNNIHVWDLNTFQFRMTLGDEGQSGSSSRAYGDASSALMLGLPKKHTDRVLSLLYHDNQLYSSSVDGFIKSWDTKSLRFKTHEFIIPIGTCWSLAVRTVNGSSHLVAAIRENDICIIDMKSLKIVSSMVSNKWAFKPEHHRDQVNSILCLDNGDILSGSSDCTVKIWRSLTPRQYPTLNQTLFKTNQRNISNINPSRPLTQQDPTRKQAFVQEHSANFDENNLALKKQKKF